MPLPRLDPDQRQAALKEAARVRQIRAELKQMLKSGEVPLAEVLDRAKTEDALARMRVSDVLAAMPSYGPVKARRLMEQVNIAPTRRVRGLGPRQREALLATFAERG